MTARKPAAKKAAAKKTAPASSRPSPAARLDALEASTHEVRQQLAQLGTQVDNIARFIAQGVAQQLQQQMMANPQLQAQLAAAQQQEPPQG